MYIYWKIMNLSFLGNYPLCVLSLWMKKFETELSSLVHIFKTKRNPLMTTPLNKKFTETWFVHIFAYIILI